MARFLHILTRPWVLLAVGLVALNDFWLKTEFPSWITGKLSDVGVLIILPLLLSGLFSLVLARRPAGGLALGLVAAAFILLKAGPQTAYWLSGGLADLAGFHLRSIPDPSDLLALPALALPARLWFCAPAAPRQTPARWRLLLVPLAGLVLLADAAMPDRGVSCLYTQANELRAQAGYFTVYASADGGLTWRLTEETWSNTCGIPQDAREALLSLPDGSAQYRITKNERVERSTDNGLTWQALDPRGLISQPEETYLRKTRSGNLTFEHPPLDALLDPSSSNLLLGMGQQGVVVVRPDGTWLPAAVGPYTRDVLKSAGLAGYFTLLTGELFLAMLAGLAWLGTAALRGRGSRAWRVVIVLGWLALLGTALVLHPEIADNSYTGMIPVLGLVVSTGWVVALLVGGVLARWADIFPKLPIALLVFVLVLLPYLLWGIGILPDYWIAALLAGGLALSAAVWVK